MARYGRDFSTRGSSIRYGMDYSQPGYVGRGRGSWEPDVGRMDRGREFRFDRGRDIDTGYGGGIGTRRNARYGMDYGERMTFRPGEYGRDRDLGDRLREGWNDVERGARRLMGRGRSYWRGYDRGW